MQQSAFRMQSAEQLHWDLAWPGQTTSSMPDLPVWQESRSAVLHFGLHGSARASPHLQLLQYARQTSRTGVGVLAAASSYVSCPPATCKKNPSILRPHTLAGTKPLNLAQSGSGSATPPHVTTGARGCVVWVDVLVVVVVVVVVVAVVVVVVAFVVVWAAGRDAATTCTDARRSAGQRRPRPRPPTRPRPPRRRPQQP